MLSKITSYHKENVDIIGRIEAVEKVRTFSYSFEWQLNIDEVAGFFYMPEVVEHKYEEDLAVFLQKWKFTGRLQGENQDIETPLICWLSSRCFLSIARRVVAAPPED